MPLSKNHAARLKRVQRHLDTALDKLMQSSGELWPRELRDLHQRVQAAAGEAQALADLVNQRLAGGVTEDPAEPQPVDPDQEDLEDVAGVAQPQPENDDEADEPEEQPVPARARRRA